MPYITSTSRKHKVHPGKLLFLEIILCFVVLMETQHYMRKIYHKGKPTIAEKSAFVQIISQKLEVEILFNSVFLFTSRVMAPPGGQTNINIFGAAEPAPSHTVNKCQASRNQSSVFAGPQEQGPPRQTRTAEKPVSNAQQSSTQQKPVNNAAPGIISADGQGNAGRASTKVMAPPGGATSISFG